MIWDLIAKESGRRIGAYGQATRESAEAWYARESAMPYRPPFFMRNPITGEEIGR
jgi:hypothetical protein